jgi:hypothetical protein
LFGRFGDADDVEIIRPFLDPENELMSSVAKRELARLENRLAEEAKNPKPEGRDHFDDPVSSGEGKTAGPGNASSEIAGRRGPGILWTIAFIIVGFALVVFGWRKLATSAKSRPFR